MSTQFFENQEAARRHTSWLVFLFACAVVSIVALLYVLAVALTAQPEADAYGRVLASRLEFWQPDLLVQVGLATLAVVSAGSLYKIAQLRRGGMVVAEALGGQLLPSDTTDPEARKILNIVEEMAIASGTPTPPVYLLAQEDGINAFAAGFTPSDAVIGVTRGCIHQLSRDELQGVIAHEFSHILNGDMRLNIRLMGALHGILLIGIIGYFLLRSSMFAGRRNSRDNSGTVILLAGVGLMVIGFLGTFFGNLIKASVSRQNEFLADASAVQFTRNPDGIAGALKKIAGLDTGSILLSPAAPEASHLFFSQGLASGLQSLFATHPPIKERIQRLDPSFRSDAVAPIVEAAQAGGVGTEIAGAAGFAGNDAAPRRTLGLPESPSGSAIDQIGQPTAAHLDYAGRLVAGLPTTIVAASHESDGARAVIYALLINRDDEARRRQFDQLDRFDDEKVAEQTRSLLRDIERLDSHARLPLIDMALPALRRLSPSQYATFSNNVKVLVDADHRIDLFEWTLHRILLSHLRPHLKRVQTRAKKNVALAKLVSESGLVLSVLAHLGSVGEDAVQKAFDKGSAQLRGISPQLLPEDQCNLSTLDPALTQLERASPQATEQLLRACAACIAADGFVSEAQGELMRAIADSLGAPMPPLLPGQKLA